MRIAHLGLVRYGKFTDCPISLPYANTDFHLIVGPNEAGKSTLRNAILDLFFGMELRSPYDFLHKYADMRIGASIQQDESSLEFHRIKGRKQTLQSPAGMPLPDHILGEYLGVVERSFFDQMFGLDHDKLVKGGNDILNSSNDVGQILFQSAAGIGSLGTIRQAFEAEAETLWAPKRANTREYYIAADELAKAEATLKLATIRAKDWIEARSVVEKITEKLNHSQEIYRELEQQRIRLERIRRVAPALTNIKEATEALNALGEVAHLPPDAATVLAAAELDIATAKQEHTLFDDLACTIADQLQNIQVDKFLIGCELDIQALSDRRQLVRNHESDIVKRQEEINSYWYNIEGCILQLGWEGENEATLQRRLPALPIRTAISRLITRHGVVQQAFSVAEAAEKEKTRDLAQLEEQMINLPGIDVAANLHAALQVARNLGDTQSSERRLKNQLAKTQREFAEATIGLGKWNLDIDVLRHLDLPANKEIEQLQDHQNKSAAGISSLQDKLADMESSIQDLEFDIDQYRTMHHPVTLAELTDARTRRDEVWESIKAGDINLLQAASDYEDKIKTADDISDNRHDTAQEANALQIKLNDLQRLKSQAAGLGLRIENEKAELIKFQNAWHSRSRNIGLVEMPLHAIGVWKETRDKVLNAAAAVTEAQSALDEQIHTTDETSHALRGALVEAGVIRDTSIGLSALIVEASEMIDTATASKARKDELLKQQRLAWLAITTLQEKVQLAHNEWDAWKASWAENIAMAGLSEATDVGTAEGALILFAQIGEKLAAIRELRQARIEMMQQDLNEFEREANALANSIAPDLLKQSPAEVAKELTARLAKAKADQSEFDRLSLELASHKGKVVAAYSKIELAEAGIRPLLQLVNASTYDELREAIRRSDSHRTLSDALAASKQSAREGGDGLLLEMLVAELESADVFQIPAELGDINRRRDELLNEQNTLSAERANATAELEKIAGQDEGARAEAARQEALARMANAAERYIKVFTAGRLLKWVIDRYRETKQGPMLSRASKIFSSLTLASFQRLVVDFECDPPALEGQRVDGKMVAVSGMSDGTRDQLYLALRLAALEIHLEQTKPLPFIADDLFINYDDARAKAGFEALANLAQKTQVIFLSHHDHLIPTVKSVLGESVNIVRL